MSRKNCVAVSWGFVIDNLPWDNNEIDPAEWIFAKVCESHPIEEVQRFFETLMCGVDYTDTLEGRKYYAFVISSAQFAAHDKIHQLNLIENIQWRTNLYNFCEAAGIEWKEPKWHMLWH